MNDISEMDHIREQLARAQRILFITGAGISADSGLPTYRGVGGLYEGAGGDDGLPIEALLSGAMLRRRPELCWKYIAQLEAACRGAQPNAAHRLIAGLEASRERVCVLTQNVDGLHRAAGSKNLIEIHGDVHQLSCMACPWEERVTDYRDLTLPPLCPRCQAVVRPRVVLFGELLPVEGIAALDREMERGFDLVFSIGTTSVFPYISGPVLDAARRGVPTVEINPGETEVSSLVRYRLRGGAAAVMEALTSRD